MSSFTVQEQSERSAALTADAAHLTFDSWIIALRFSFHLFQSCSHSLRLDRRTWGRVYGVAAWGRIQTKCHRAHPTVHGWVSDPNAQSADSRRTHVKNWKSSIARCLSPCFPGNPAIVPKRILRTRWFTDPWTCGSYSYPAVGSSAQDMKNLTEPLPMEASKSQVGELIENPRRLVGMNKLCFTCCVSAPTGVVCRRGYSYPLLLHRPRSSPQWAERGWSAHRSLLSQTRWSIKRRMRWITRYQFYFKSIANDSQSGTECELIRNKVMLSWSVTHKS